MSELIPGGGKGNRFSALTAADLGELEGHERGEGEVRHRRQKRWDVGRPGQTNRPGALLTGTKAGRAAQKQARRGRRHY